MLAHPTIDRLTAERNELAKSVNDRIAKAMGDTGGLSREEFDALKPDRERVDELDAQIDRTKDALGWLDAKATRTFGHLPTPDGTPPGAPVDEDGWDGKSIGAAFVESDGYKRLFGEDGARGSKWDLPAFEVKGSWDAARQVNVKTTLTEASGSGGPLIIPDYQTGILPILLRRLVVADLIPPGRTTSNLIRYFAELSLTNSAAATAEGGTKPESALAFVSVDEPVRKITTLLPISEEMLEDVPQARTYIDNRLGTFIQLAEEDELLNGAGGSPHLTGLLNRTGLQTTHQRPTSAETLDEAIARQRSIIANASFLNPDSIILNPGDGLSLALERDGFGRYIFGGPVDVNGYPANVWGLRAVYTPAMTAGLALVGAFQQGAQMFRRSGITIDASNSHNDDFAKNLVHVRAEERLGLAVYRPGAFGLVNFTPLA